MKTHVPFAGQSILLGSLLVILGGFQGAAAVAEEDEYWTVEGRVVDEQGQPVLAFDAAHYWSANGRQWNDEGNAPELRTDQEIAEFWDDEGQMLPWPEASVDKLDGGRFRCRFRRVYTTNCIYAMDPGQKRGGYVTVKRDQPPSPVTITLAPLARVFGEVSCSEAGKTPGWTCVRVHTTGDFDNCKILTTCGSMRGRFSFLLPPGVYDFAVYSESPDAHMPKPDERQDAPDDMPPYLGGIRVHVSPGQSELDLGTLDVRLTTIGRYQVAGQWGNFRDHFCKQPPPLEFSDARGVERSFQLADLRGKWVVLDFWDLHCGPCIARSIPELMSFYGRHEEQRDRFEIVSICADWGDRLKTIEQFETAAKPFVAKHWGGKLPEFPILIDPGGKTRASYGVQGVPLLLLVDPEGRLVNVETQPVLTYLEARLQGEPRPKRAAEEEDSDG